MVASVVGGVNAVGVEVVAVEVVGGNGLRLEIGGGGFRFESDELTEFYCAAAHC